MYLHFHSLVLSLSPDLRRTVQHSAAIFSRATALADWVPCGLVVRIRRSHRRGRGSIPRTGGPNFLRRSTKYVVHSSQALLCYGDYSVPLLLPVYYRASTWCVRNHEGAGALSTFSQLVANVFCATVDDGRFSYRQGSRDMLPWRNWLARSAVNRKVGGSSPPGSVSRILRTRRIPQDRSFNQPGRRDRPGSPEQNTVAS